MSAKPYRDTLPRLRRHEPIGPGLRRVVHECVNWALAADPAQIDEAVHEARCALKRARAVLKLGDALGVTGVKAAQRRLGRIARELSPRRDAAVAAKVADRVGRKLELDPAAAGATPHAWRKKTPAPRNWWTRWCRTLAAERGPLNQLDWGQPTMARLDAALAKASKRVRRRAKAAAETRDVALAHEWRKAVIVLREQMLVTKLLLAPKSARLATRLHDLASRLGRALDYSVFESRIRRRAAGRPGGRVEKFGRRRQRRALRHARRDWPKLKRQLRRRLKH